MQIKCSTEFVKQVSKNAKKHFALTWMYLIAGGACVYKAIEHSNITGKNAIFKDILTDEYKEEPKDAEDVKE